MTAATTPYSTRRALDESELAACFQVRKDVFVGEQQVPEDIEYDTHDATAVHVLAVAADGSALGTGRLLHGEAAAGKTGGDHTVGSLGRLAVTREARGLGVGAALVRAIEDVRRDGEASLADGQSDRKAPLVEFEECDQLAEDTR
nr:GNAT family N-acetyltransferase [Streptomyces sp. FT05W]